MSRAIFAAAVVAAITAGPAFAADHIKLEEGLPIETESATPTSYLGREFQTVFRYQREDNGTDSLLVTPRVEIGFPRNSEVSIAVPYLSGEIEPDGLRELELEFKHNINQETLLLPTMSLAVGADFPTGSDTHGVDPFVKILATKTLSRDFHFHQAHFNYYHQFNDDVQSDERSDRYKISAAYSTRLNNETTWLAGITREQEREEDVELNLVETGLRYQLTPRTVLSGGVGFGVGDESPDVRATFGFQFSF